jgi:hypothetical protein
MSGAAGIGWAGHLGGRERKSTFRSGAYYDVAARRTELSRKILDDDDDVGLSTECG